MFEGLSEKLSGIFDQLTRRGALSEADVEAALREVRRALLEADVALDVVRGFTDKARERAVGANVIKSVSPGQMVVKIVSDVLTETLGAEAEPIDLNAPAPVAIMMVGLQGAGKTTTTAKIAKRLTERQKKKVLMASLDVKRPAAQEQLAVLGRQVGVHLLGGSVAILRILGQGLVEEVVKALAQLREDAAKLWQLVAGDRRQGLFDRRPREQGPSGYTKFGDVAGNGWVQAGAAVATYAIGTASDMPKVAHIGSDLIRGQVLTGLITRGLKVGVDRTRPSGGRHSFPSGHSSAAFLTASVLGSHFGWKAASAVFFNALVLTFFLLS